MTRICIDGPLSTVSSIYPQRTPLAVGSGTAAKMSTAIYHAILQTGLPDAAQIVCAAKAQFIEAALGGLFWNAERLRS
jgi:hypothetical protein